MELTIGKNYQEKQLTLNVETTKLAKLGFKTVTNLCKLVLAEHPEVAFLFNTLKKVTRYEANLLYLTIGKVDADAYAWLRNDPITEDDEIYSIYDNKGLRNMTRDALIVMTPIVVTTYLAYFVVLMTGDQGFKNEAFYALSTVTGVFNFFKQIRKVAAVYHGGLLYGKEMKLKAAFEKNPALKGLIVQFLDSVAKEEGDNQKLLGLQKEITNLLKKDLKTEDLEEQKTELKDLFKKYTNGQLKTDVRQFTAKKAIFKGLGLALRVGGMMGLPVSGVNKVVAIITGGMAAYKRRTWGPQVKAEAKEIKAALEKAAGKKKQKEEKVKKDKNVFSMDPLAWAVSKLLNTPFKFKVRIITGVEKVA